MPWVPCLKAENWKSLSETSTMLCGWVLKIGGGAIEDMMGVLLFFVPIGARCFSYAAAHWALGNKEKGVVNRKEW